PEWQAGAQPWSHATMKVLLQFLQCGVFTITDDDLVVLGPSRLTASLYDQFADAAIKQLRQGPMKLGDAEEMAITWIRTQYARAFKAACRAIEPHEMFTSLTEPWYPAASLALAVLHYASIVFRDDRRGEYHSGSHATGGRMAGKQMSRMVQAAPGFLPHELA